VTGVRRLADRSRWPTTPKCACPTESPIRLPIRGRDGRSKGVGVLNNGSSQRANPLVVRTRRQLNRKFSDEDFHGLSNQRTQLRQIKRVAADLRFNSNDAHDRPHKMPTAWFILACA